MVSIIFAIQAVSIYSMQIDCVYVNIDWIEVGKYYTYSISKVNLPDKVSFYMHA